MMMTWAQSARLHFMTNLRCIRTNKKVVNPNKKVSRCMLHTTTTVREKSPDTELCQQLRTRIRATGPITVADYMKEVLTSPVSGYYMNKDVFGTQGDFITSPEISQMFGELLGIWCVNEWMQCGCPPSIQIVELGPGRGTLMADMLRVFSRFKIKNAVSIHLVEVSPMLSQLQLNNLCKESPQTFDSAENKCYMTCRTTHGNDISWYRHLNDVPHGFSFYVAHEFFDALPVHIFQKKDGMWHEMLVDIDESEDGEHHLRFVLSFNPTAASKVLLEVASDSECETAEICPEAGILTQIITDRLLDDGGFALIADYGDNVKTKETFRAFKDHKVHHPLCEPGTADLTADVDFSYFKKVINNKVTTLGPMAQGKFLQNMGISVRLQMLLKNASAEQQGNLISGFKMLTDPEQMGARFKFFAMLQHRDEYMPAGFSPV